MHCIRWRCHQLVENAIITDSCYEWTDSNNDAEEDEAAEAGAVAEAAEAGGEDEGEYSGSKAIN